MMMSEAALIERAVSGAGRRALPKGGRVRVVLVGCGAIAEQMHLPVLAGHEGVELVGLVDRDEGRARRLALGYGVKVVAGDVGSIADGSFDAAILATPPFHHGPGAIGLMRRGVHVLVEKPMALNLAEAEEMCRVAEEEGVRLAVGYFRRLYPSIRLLKGMMDGGAWGRVKSFAVESGGMYSWAAATLGNMRKDLAGGGVLIDFGSHVVDLLFALFDEPAEVIEYVDNSLGGVEADCEMRLALMHAGERVEGTVALARTRNLGNWIRVECERGTLEFGFNERHRVRVLLRDGGVVDPVGGESRGTWMEAGFEGEDEEISWYDTFRLQMDDFVAAIAEGREPLLSGRSALATVRVIDGCYSRKREMEESWVWAGMGRNAEGGMQNSEGGGRGAEVGTPTVAVRIGGLGTRSVPATRRRVLVTGASGFIGSRVAEIMHLRDGWDVRAVVHNPGNASRLARLPVEMVQGDLKDEATVKRLVEGCDAVVHCAVGTAWGQRKEIFAVTVEGTRRLAEAALAAGVKRLVHLSTISVYGDDSAMTGLIDEATQPRPVKGSEYGESKLEAERVVQQLVGRGLSAVILRPARVYGPYSRIFVTRPMQAIAEGRFRWLGNPDVPADLVYVDNVVEMILRSVDAPEAVGRGEVFCVSDGDDLTWREFYQRLADGVGVRLSAPVYERAGANGHGAGAWWNPGAWVRAGKTVVTSAEFKSLGRRVLNTDPVGNLPRWGLATFPGLERAARRMVGADGALPVYRREAAEVSDWVEMGSGGALVSIEKARRLLSYEPRIGRDEALALTVDWIKHARLV